MTKPISCKFQGLSQRSEAEPRYLDVVLVEIISPMHEATSMFEFGLSGRVERVATEGFEGVAVNLNHNVALRVARTPPKTQLDRVDFTKSLLNFFQSRIDDPNILQSPNDDAVRMAANISKRSIEILSHYSARHSLATNHDRVSAVRRDLRRISKNVREASVGGELIVPTQDGDTSVNTLGGLLDVIDKNLDLMQNFLYEIPPLSQINLHQSLPQQKVGPLQFEIESGKLRILHAPQWRRKKLPRSYLPPGKRLLKRDASYFDNCASLILTIV